ncbi:MAG: hypothetical protein ABWU14_09415 [Limnospira maxima]|nr:MULTISPECIES: hypothetical protein [Limnospira]EKD08640.1 hypothetical protein SPLC1_S200400 [Arthrospira platensis C1]MDT9201244.1 hypothetical protein [Limnospira sp. PMC 1042.18]MDT9247087.1 hypothetical protein [Limnospira sp. PMC 1249.20]MDT9277765.1 hypothetical protein [Limnospira sp. PMC 737.11]MDT9303412.1 hypothetical protein [Limnospira sp. PMC 1281.21]QNH57611.1 MAG: hypothetical protein H2674_26660 [Limnospira indica BM01]
MVRSVNNLSELNFRLGGTMAKNGLYGYIGVVVSLGILIGQLPAEAQPPTVLSASHIISRYRSMVEESEQPELHKRMLLLSAQNDLKSIVEDVGDTCQALASGGLTWRQRQAIQEESLRQDMTLDPQIREILRTDQSIRNNLVKQMCPQYIR